MQFDYDIVQLLNRKLEQYAISDNVVIGVATSGGVDSQVLLHAVCNSASGKNLMVHAIYVNHSVRSKYATSRDVRAIRSITERYQIPLHICVVPRAAVLLQSHRQGLESACRQVRYRMYKKLASQLQLSGLLLGHHYDDQIESLWLQILRGRRAAHIRPQSIAEQFTFQCGNQSITVYRPLIDIPKRALLHYAQHHTVAFHHDHTNTTLTNDRSVLRNVIIKKIVRYFPYANHIMMRQHQYQAMVYKQLIAHAVSENYRWFVRSERAVYLDLNEFSALPSVVQCHLLLEGIAMLFQQVVAGDLLSDSIQVASVSNRFLMYVVNQLNSRKYFQIRKSNLVVIAQQNRLYLVYHVETFLSLWYHKLLIVEPTNRSTVVVALSYHGSEIFNRRLCDVVGPCRLSIHRTQDCVNIMIYSRSIHRKYFLPINILGVRFDEQSWRRDHHVSHKISDSEGSSSAVIHHKTSLDTL